MKRKEVEFTDDQYARIVTALSPDRKRQLLEHLTADEVAIGKYKDPKIFKDIIQNFLIGYLDIGTYVALGSTCKRFYKLFRTRNYSSVKHIQVCYLFNATDELAAASNTIQEIFRYVFYNKIIMELKLPFIDTSIKTWAGVEKSMAKTQFWIKMEGVNIQYPTGFIRKINGKTVIGNIFHRDGLIRFYKDKTAGYAKVRNDRPVSATGKSLLREWNNQYRIGK
jgi:hypothetical protein